KAVEVAERARLADEEKTAAEAVEAEKGAEEQRKAAFDKIVATNKTRKLNKVRLFVVSIVVLLCLGSVIAWFFKIRVFSREVTSIVVGDRDKTAKVRDVQNGKKPLTLSGHSGSVNSVAFSPDGT